MYKILAIYEKDADYSGHLAAYIKSKVPGLFHIRLFTREEALKDYLKEEKPDILLWGEEGEGEGVTASECGCLVALSETPLPKKGHPGAVIYKYQPGEAILKELKKLLPRDTLDGLDKEMGQGEVFTVFSLGCEKERQGFSLTLLREKRGGKPSVYFTLEAFPLLEELRTGSNEKGLSEFIYYLKQNPGTLQKRLEEFVHPGDNFFYLKGAAFGTDIFELTAEDMENWLRLFCRPEYGTLIFDTEIFSPAILKLFQSSNCIYILTEEGSFGEARLKNFLCQLRWAGYEELTERMVHIRIGEKDKQKYGDSLLVGLGGTCEKTGNY